MGEASTLTHRHRCGCSTFKQNLEFLEEKQSTDIALVKAMVGAQRFGLRNLFFSLNFCTCLLQSMRVVFKKGFFSFGVKLVRCARIAVPLARPRV